MDIQWYPGHMTKARRAMQEDIKRVDLVIELVDARAPLASRNPDIDELASGKARILILNKADLADEKANEAWTRYFKQKGLSVLSTDSKKGMGLKKLLPVVREACKDKIERDRKRGMNRPVRAMVVGIPNVGKSTLINSFVGKAITRTADKPGVTKGNQWIRLNESLELLDTPGILWPKFDDQETGLLLAMIGSVNDEILNKEELADELLKRLSVIDPQGLKSRYGLDLQGPVQTDDEAASILESIGRKRGYLIKGGEVDMLKAAVNLLDEFRAGKLGRVTLQLPPQN